MDNEDTIGGGYFLFNCLYVAAQVFGGTAFILIAASMAFFRGGYDGFCKGAQGKRKSLQDRPKNEFHFHPLLMSLALLLLNGQAILVYRGFRRVEKIYTKRIHAAVQLAGLLIAVLGLKAVFDSHNYKKPEPDVNLYSLHSWIGLSAVSLFALQWIGGFLMFFKPGTSVEVRLALMPLHRLSGIVIFVIALCAALMGVAELSAWSMECWLKDKVICSEMWLANLFGVSVTLYAALVIALVAHLGWIRQPLPSELAPLAETTVYTNTD